MTPEKTKGCSYLQVLNSVSTSDVFYRLNKLFEATKGGGTEDGRNEETVVD